MKPNTKTTEKTTQASLGAFALSILIHGAVLLLVGGYVIFEGIVPKTPFLPANVGVMGDAEEYQEPTEQPESMPELPSASGELMEVAASESDTTSTTSADILVSTGVNSSFTLGPAVGPITSVPKLGGGMPSGTGQKTGGGGGRGPGGPGMSSLFGSKSAGSGSLTGELYDLKQLKDGKRSPAESSNKVYQEIIREFTDSGWKSGKLDAYFKAPTKLYATQFFMPLIPAENGPKTFEVDDKVKPERWLIHYKGQWTPSAAARFRFVGAAGEILVVRFGGKIVLDGSHSYIAKPGPPVSSWVPSEEVGIWKAFPKGNKWAEEFLVFGDWINVNPDQSYPMEVLIGERGGTDFYAFLLVEGLGPKPKEIGKGAKAFPIFSTLPEGAEVPSFDPKFGPALVD